jgi:hypothetical protein
VQPALVAIWLSVLLGAGLGVWQRFAPQVTEPIRTFAVVAAALVVSLSLLPHALASEGLAGLLAATAGYLAIPALERLGMGLFRRMDPHALRLELGYAGLLLHRFGDGVAMSVEGHGHGVLWALGAHEVPIVALVTLAFGPRGLRVALLRATALGVSSSLGYFIMHALPAESWHALHGWADAAAAGVLVHIVAHEGLRMHAHAHAHAIEVTPEPPRSLPQRLLDLGAALLACGLIAALSLDHDAGALELLGHLLQLALQVSPWLCLGLLLRVVLRLRLQLKPRLVPLLTALDPAALVLSLALLGGAFSAVYLALALLSTAGLLALRWGSRSAAPEAASPVGQARLTSLGTVLEHELVPLVSWVVLGFLSAVYVRAYVSPLSVDGSPSTRWAWAAVVAALACRCVPAAVPLAAALVALGLPPASALAGLLVGVCVPPLLGSAHGLGLPPRTARATLLLSLAAGSTLAALPEGLLFASLGAGPLATTGRELSWLSLAVLLGFVGRQIWQTGVRTWLAASLGATLWSRSGHGPESASPGHG